MFVEIEQLTFRYPRQKQPVIENFSLQMDKGEIIGVLGSSGSGKSTLLRLIAGLELPTKGRISIDGRVVVSESEYVDTDKRGVGMVFQDYALFPHLTVERNILFGLHRLPAKERNTRLNEMLELVRLQDFRHRYPHELSGGQQQRVAFARALAPKPLLLLMDEPFSNLDADLKLEIREELKHILRSEKITSVFVTHDKDDADFMCDRIVQMKSLAYAAAY